MKKFLTLFLTLAVLAGTFSFPVANADDIVNFRLVCAKIAEGDTTFTVDLVAHLPEDGDVTQVGVLVTVPEGLNLVDFERQYTKGMFTRSVTTDANPYMILWIAGTASLPEGDTVLCTLTFEADEALAYGDSYYIDLEMDPYNPPATVAGYLVDATYYGCSVEIAPPPVEFSLEASEISLGDTTFTVDLVAHLPEGGDVTVFAVLVTVPEGLNLVRFQKVYTDKGMFTCSETYDTNPYTIIWVAGTASLPEGDTVMCTLTFEADEPFATGDSYYIGLEANPDNPPATVTCYAVDADFYGCIAEVMGPTLNFALETEGVKNGETSFTVDLTVTLPDNATGYELGSFCLEMNYDSSVMHLADAPEWKVTGGNHENSKELTDMPYKLVWLSIDEEEQFSAGKNVIATMTFELAEPAVRGNEYTISLAGNPKNFVVSMASDDGVYSEFKYDPNDVTFENAVFSTIINYGDANEDDLVNVFDVSLILRYIVGWTDLNLDEVAADVNLDGDVTLLDASRILKYIAKWSGITLGTR